MRHHGEKNGIRVRQMVCVLGEGIRDPDKLTVPDLQECFYLTTSCLTDSTFVCFRATCAKSLDARGGESQERWEAEAKQVFLQLLGAPIWVPDPGEGRSPCALRGAA